MVMLDMGVIKSNVRSLIKMKPLCMHVGSRAHEKRGLGMSTCSGDKSFRS